MRITCPYCSRSLEYADEPPAFCGYCGKSLEVTRPETPLTEAQRTAAPAHGLADVPECVGGYRLLRRLGAGGMGTVYEAEAIADGRRVALKLIIDDFAASPDSIERFRQEGRLASAIAHPRCVFVLAADEDAGRPFIVMELMPGTTLKDLVKERGPLPAEEAVAKIMQVAEGLREAHRLGVIHRDVKPSNCFLDRDGSVKIGDFGLSKSLTGSAELTRSGAFVGTPLYASPEQIRKEPLDAQTDVYSLAATLYFLLTGRAPFQSKDATATMARIVSEPPPSLRTLRPELSRSLDLIVRRGLERDRAKRYRSLDEFREALLPLLPEQPTFGDVATRVGSFVLDYLFHVVVFALPFARATNWAMVAENPRLMIALVMAVYLTVGCLLYGVFEGFWGATPGKWLLNLRVCETRSTDPPGFVRALGRAVVFVTLLGLFCLPTSLVTFQEGVRTIGVSFFYFAGPFVLLCVGVGILASTMRTGNGYRGLHEIASGTRVIRLPASATRRRYASVSLVVATDAGLPACLGPYDVQGVAAAVDDGFVLLGEDPALGRKVFLSLRPGTTAELQPARRDLARPGRLRWLAQGIEGDWRWDAFLAPSGCPLRTIVAGGRLAWSDASLLLSDLTAELDAACRDHTMPAELNDGQVWVRDNGTLLLLDWPLARDTLASTSDEEPESRAVALLRRTAVLLLEGRPLAAEGGRRTIRVPLPLYARAALLQLFDDRPPAQQLATLHQELTRAANRPARVSRPRRLGHLALQGGILYLAFMFMLLAFNVLAVVPVVHLEFQAQDGDLVRDVLRDRAGQERRLAAANPDPEAQFLAENEWQFNESWCVKVDRVAQAAHAQSAARRRALGWFSQGTLEGAEPLLQNAARAQQKIYRQRLESEEMGYVRGDANYELKRVTMYRQYVRRMTTVVEGIVLFWFAAWIVWAFLFRGGLSLRLTGIALVRADGRPAGRFQCLWRALLVWVPVAALLFVSIEMEQRYWAAWDAAQPREWQLWFARALRWVAWGLLLLWVVLALGRPRRTLHDWLAGTYLVPR